jgi:hypothetical protein
MRLLLSPNASGWKEKRRLGFRNPAHINSNKKTTEGTGYNIHPVPNASVAESILNLRRIETRM